MGPEAIRRSKRLCECAGFKRPSGIATPHGLHPNFGVPYKLENPELNSSTVLSLFCIFLQ